MDRALGEADPAGQAAHEAVQLAHLLQRVRVIRIDHRVRAQFLCEPGAVGVVFDSDHPRPTVYPVDHAAQPDRPQPKHADGLARLDVARAEGALLAIHLSSPQKFWEGLCKSVGHPELIDDPHFNTRPNRRTNYDELQETFAVFFKEQPRSVWIEKLEANDVPHTPA